MKKTNEVKNCTKCKGLGHIYWTNQSWGQGLDKEEIEPCEVCSGKGVVSVSKKVSGQSKRITIPKKTNKLCERAERSNTKPNDYTYFVDHNTVQRFVEDLVKRVRKTVLLEIAGIADKGANPLAHKAYREAYKHFADRLREMAEELK